VSTSSHRSKTITKSFAESPRHDTTAGGEENWLAGQLPGQQMLPQGLDALPFIIPSVCIIEQAGPRRRVMDNKRKSWLLEVFCTAILQTQSLVDHTAMVFQVFIGG
jgi:hypothetical protein